MRIKAFLDTNVFLDLFVQDRKSTPASNTIFQAVLDRKIEAVMTSQSILDAYYIYSSDTKGPIEDFFGLVNKAVDYVNMESICNFDLRWAMEHYSGDFEDDAHVARALDTCCDVFVTNDKKLCGNYNGKYELLKFMTPEEFVFRMTAGQ